MRRQLPCSATAHRSFSASCWSCRTRPAHTMHPALPRSCRSARRFAAMSAIAWPAPKRRKPSCSSYPAEVGILLNHAACWRRQGHAAVGRNSPVQAMSKRQRGPIGRAERWIRKWYGQPESNRHAFRRQILSLLRLPVSPWPRTGPDCTTCGRDSVSS